MHRALTAALSIGLLAAAGTGLPAAHAQNQQSAKPRAETHDCPAGTKWQCESRPNTSKPSGCGPGSGAIMTGYKGCKFPDTKVCGCN